VSTPDHSGILGIMNFEDKPGWLSRKEAGARAKVSPRTINRWRADGLLTWAYVIRGGQLVPVYEPESVDTAVKSSRKAKAA